MLSVMTPVKVCLPCAAASAPMATRVTIRNFTCTSRYCTARVSKRTSTPIFCGLALAARCHQVGGRRARIHDPHATLLGVVGQSECLRGGARHGDGSVLVRVLLVGALQVDPHRSE